MDKTKIVSDSLSYDDNEILGKGTAGFVFRGSFGQDKNPVAVKRVQLASLRKDEDFQKREEDALASLDHPNVVKLFHAEDDLTFRYYVLELCAASLDQCFLPDRDLRKYKGALPSDQEVLLQMAKGLQYIHSMNLVHRDIKPENMMISITQPVHIKLADFGLCKPVNQRGTFSISGIKGTQYWMAPEILALEDQPYSKNDVEGANKGRGTMRSDIFALGLVFFTFLTNGLHLFGSKNLIISNVMRGKPNPANQSRLDQNHFAREIISNMTKSKPEDRIPLTEVVNMLRPQVHQSSPAFRIEDSESL
ncbi:serine/threonine-protein kinase/endoribonuclease ire-1-like [Daphnia pulex]|uniref:serine/threonine-protein kinase/endoribonuclease ire-1-like n=1 Tax=Daphnia pulex TaxID=6669 RepID=UPI001EDE30C7|nr:serine/threonine-protein kinase/endoribonuclease ire-1-like [Daphnia pulex]